MSQLALFGSGAAASDAAISPCGRYRYRLSRTWDQRARRVNFIMLNPSTADASEDDRCVGFAKAWGYGGLVVTNLFAWRATDPKELGRTDDPIGPENDDHIREVAFNEVKVVCAWGTHGVARAGRVRSMLRDMGTPTFALRLTKGGCPSHPLYLPADLVPIPY